MIDSGSERPTSERDHRRDRVVLGWRRDLGRQPLGDQLTMVVPKHPFASGTPISRPNSSASAASAAARSRSPVSTASVARRESAAQWPCGWPEAFGMLDEPAQLADRLGGRLSQAARHCAACRPSATRSGSSASAAPW